MSETEKALKKIGRIAAGLSLLIQFKENAQDYLPANYLDTVNKMKKWLEREMSRTAQRIKPIIEEIQGDEESE